MTNGNAGSFQRIAQYYEVLANARERLRRESTLLRGVLERAPGHRVLDLACGTGLHALWFAEQGGAVTATDLSEAMIAYAHRHRSHDRITYEVSDMRTPPDGQWDLAVCLGNSLSLLTTEADVRAVFAAIGARLMPDGLFLIQLLNYARPEAQQPRHRIEKGALPEGSLVAVKSLVPFGNVTLLSLGFFAESGGGAFDTAAETAILRHWSPEDMVAAADEGGLDPLAFYGGFDESKFDAQTSPDLIATFVKRQR